MSANLFHCLSDLGHWKSADVIYSALEDCWNVALSSGAKVLAMTVPECGVRLDKLDTNRDALNSRIRERESENL